MTFIEIRVGEQRAFGHTRWAYVRLDPQLLITYIMSNYIKALPIALFLLAGLASADPDQMTYTITGTGSGYWGAQQFTNAAFKFTASAYITDIGNQTSSGPLFYSTHNSTSPLAISVAGFTGDFTSNGAVFINEATDTVGIWQDGVAEFLTVANPVFANYDPLTNIGPVSGTTWAYGDALTLSVAHLPVYFTSVSGVTFTAQRSGNYGELSNVSMSPANGTASIGAQQTYSFVFNDTLGASDLKIANILFSDPGQAVGSSTYNPQACWAYVDLTAKSISMYRNNAWTAAVPFGGGAATGNECTINMQGAAIATNQTQLTLTLPITLTPSVQITNQWPVFASASNQQATAEYQQMGTVTVSPALQPGFTLTMTPSGPQNLVIGSGTSSISYILTVVPTGGFQEPVIFSATGPPNQNPQDLGISFNPHIVYGAGSTILTISTTPSTVDGSTYVTVTGSGPTGPVTLNTGTIYLAHAAPAVSVSPGAGSSASQLITVTATDPSDAHNINGINLLIAPTFNGINACWVYSDGAGLWLATDDATSWMYAGAIGSSTPASNSQCTVGGIAGTASTGPAQTLNIGIPVTFQPSFAGGKTVWVRASNLAGLDSGYQALTTWSVP